MSANLIHFSFGDVRVMWLNFLKMIKIQCVVHMVYFLYAIMHVFC